MANAKKVATKGPSAKRYNDAAKIIVKDREALQAKRRGISAKLFTVMRKAKTVGAYREAAKKVYKLAPMAYLAYAVEQKIIEVK
jgi:hypothetical protein